MILGVTVGMLYIVNRKNFVLNALKTSHQIGLNINSKDCTQKKFCNYSNVGGHSQNLVSAQYCYTTPILIISFVLYF